MERIYTSREKFAEDWGTDVPGPEISQVVFYGLGGAAVLEYVFTEQPIKVDTEALAEVKELERILRLE